jgi:hypothetical protein
MHKLENMVDMARTPRETDESPAESIESSMPVYPYGLAISFGEDELEKLGVDYSDWSVGDHFHLHALAKITSISERETEGGNCCRVELQIVALSGENEEEENEEYEEKEPAFRPLG